MIYSINLLCYLIPRNNCIGRAFNIFYYLQAVLFLSKFQHFMDILYNTL